MVQRQSISHFKPLIVDIINLEGQGRGNIRSLPRPLLLKSEFFTKSGGGRPILKPRHQSKCQRRGSYPNRGRTQWKGEKSGGYSATATRKL